VGRLLEYLKAHPAMEAVYGFWQKLNRLLRIKHRTARHCRRLIPVFLKALQELRSPVSAPLNLLGDTFDSWKEEIVRMWRFTKTNGITEGFHKQMEMISRRAFGFRNFENYGCACASSAAADAGHRSTRSFEEILRIHNLNTPSQNFSLPQTPLRGEHDGGEFARASKYSGFRGTVDCFRRCPELPLPLFRVKSLKSRRRSLMGGRRI